MDDRDECPVCYESTTTRVVCVTPCAHSVCMECMVRLSAPVRCPMCRADLSEAMPPPPAPPTPRSVVELSLSPVGESVDMATVVRRARLTNELRAHAPTSSRGAP